MVRRNKYPFLYDKDWWKDNQNKTDVEIGRKFKCPHSTVRAARHRMGIPPLSGKWLIKKQWQSIEFRKKRSNWPQLFEKSFWEKNRYKTNLEIAEKLGCTSSSVSAARKFMGIQPLTRSEAQKRRYKREGFPKERIEMSSNMRKLVLKRAKNRCEILNCGLSGKDVLQIDHIIDMSLHENPEDANQEQNLIVLCKWHHSWWTKYKKENPDKFRNSGNPYSEAIKLINIMFPS